MDYIKRTLEQKILEINEDYSCLLLIGPRQVGKTTMLEHLMKGTNRQKVTLDDTENRRLAKTDPALFLELHPAPVLIDEVQYAPELFSYIKINVDNGAASGSYWLTGSQAFQLMELAQESLAGRTAIVHMSALSQSELYGDHWSEPLSLDLQKLNSRKEHLAACGSAEMFERIWRGSMPGHASGKFRNREVFYGSYVDTYIERDVTDEIPGVDRPRFRDFVRAAACRVGQLLSVHDIARDVDVADNTAKRWLRVLERSEIIHFLRPYSNNLLKRTVKTPKLYFFDTGLVAYLTRYSSPEILQNGALAGDIFENYVVNEVLKGYKNAGTECLLWYYRDMDAREIDMVLEANGTLHPLEIKKSASPAARSTFAFRQLDKASMPRGVGAVVCMKPRVTPISREVTLIPAWTL